MSKPLHTMVIARSSGKSSFWACAEGRSMNDWRKLTGDPDARAMRPPQLVGRAPLTTKLGDIAGRSMLRGSR